MKLTTTTRKTVPGIIWALELFEVNVIKFITFHMSPWVTNFILSCNVFHSATLKLGGRYLVYEIWIKREFMKKLLWNSEVSWKGGGFQTVSSLLLGHFFLSGKYSNILENKSEVFERSDCTITVQNDLYYHELKIKIKLNRDIT